MTDEREYKPIFGGNGSGEDIEHKHLTRYGFRIQHAHRRGEIAHGHRGGRYLGRVEEETKETAP